MKGKINVPISIEKASELPILKHKDKILDIYKQNDCILIIGETGSGKTTQIPQFINEHLSANRLFGRIAITQPRRVAAMSLAKRVAEEMKVPLGSTVGYSVRFEEATSAETCIKFVTDGMLLRELISDPSLSRYSTIIIDEVHERTLRTDILLGVLKRLQTIRKMSLKIVLMSATIDPEEFVNFFAKIAVYRVPGRQYPVKIFYTSEPQQDYLDATIVTIFQLHMEKPLGDMLVFLTGQDEIESVEAILQEYAPNCSSGSPRMIICPLFASLPASQQMAIFRPTPSGCRKVILATNIAETSITIPGIKYVIDPGFVKQRQYNPRSGIESLLIKPSSQSSCRQRCGRAGRESSGECYRLFTEDAFKTILPKETIPEILRTNLANVILTMKASEIHDIFSFEFIKPPSLESLKRGLEELLALGALDSTSKITPLGRQMAECPQSPQLARILIEAKGTNFVTDVISILAMLSAESLFIATGKDREKVMQSKKVFMDMSGDHMTLLNVYNGFMANQASPLKWCAEHCIDYRSMKHICQVRDQLDQFVTSHQFLPSTGKYGGLDKAQTILKCLCSGYFLQCAAKQADGTFKTVVGRQVVNIHPSSSLYGATKSDCIIYHDITYTTKCYARVVSIVNSTWIQEFVNMSTR